MKIKTERPDEKFACKKILEYCQLIPEDIFYEPNGESTAPDYVFYIKERDESIKINLEIRTVWGVQINSDGQNIRERQAIDPFEGFNKSLKLLANNWIKKGESFFVNCLSRLPSKKSCKIPLHKWVKPLNKEIKRLDTENKIPVRHIVPVKDNLEDSIIRYTKSIHPYYFSLEFKGEILEFEVDKEIYEDVSQASSCIEIFSCSISPNPLFDYSFESQAFINLQLSILKKEKLLSKTIGEKWLGIIDGPSCLDKNSYQNAYKALIKDQKFSHSFSKIFVILRSDVVELTSLKLDKPVKKSSTLL